MKYFIITLFLITISVICFKFFYAHPSDSADLLASAIKQDLKVEIKTVGELEAARSTIIASSIKGDQGKIIDLIADGVYVQPGEILVRIDPSPFEEKIEKLKLQIKEQEVYLHSLQQGFEWEEYQAEHKNRMASYEIETAQLELDKLLHGEGPQEISKLQAAKQKAWLKYEELNAYSNDLLELESQGFLNTNEVKQAQKKLNEEKESYEIAQAQYEGYLQHVYPMLVKKGETHLKRFQINQEEVFKTGIYQIAKASNLLNQAEQMLEDYSFQLIEAEKELLQTEIKAPSSGMVVHREDYRSGQKRKPRVGDILVKNQPLIDLPDLSAMMVKTKVREIDLYKIETGRKAFIKVEAYPHLSFEGTLISIGVLALNDFHKNDEKYFEVRILLEKNAPCLRPGMTTLVTIQAQEARNILTIPIHAVFNEQEQHFCYIKKGESDYEKRPIQTGIHNEQWMEVTQGLEEGNLISLIPPFIL